MPGSDELGRFFQACCSCHGVTIKTKQNFNGLAHTVVVVDNQIIAQGYLSGSNPTNDGAGLIRPYINTIHGHWTNNPLATIDSLLYAAKDSVPHTDSDSFLHAAVSVTVHGRASGAATSIGTNVLPG